MAFPQRVLGDGEHLLLHEHQHWKALVLPIALVPVVVGLAAFGFAAMPAGSVQTAGRYTVIGVALILLFAFSFLPWLRWRTTHFVLTDQRIILRSGILSRTGRDIPLARVNDVTFTHTLFERLLRCGTLVVESGGERGQLVVDDMPRVEDVQRQLAELVEKSLDGRRIAPPEQWRHDDSEEADATRTVD
jgi:uncharacterized membrane protein YdbT with pleckstrin-like domain